MNLTPTIMPPERVAEILSSRLGGSPASWNDWLQEDRLNESPELPYKVLGESKYYYEHLVYEYIRRYRDGQPFFDVQPDFDFETYLPRVRVEFNGELYSLSISAANALASQIKTMARKLSATRIEKIVAMFEPRLNDQEGAQP